MRIGGQVRGRERDRAFATLMVTLLITVGFIGIIDFSSEYARAGPTYVSGTVYDGAGGPWTIAGSPYIILDDVNVPAGENLTIEAGVTVRVDGYTAIYVDGNLTAMGDELNRIVMTSNETNPSVGEWWGISLNLTSHAEFGYCDIIYASNGIIIYSSSNVILNSTITTGWYGLVLEGSSSNVITNNSIYNNRWIGIDLSWANNNTITHNNITSNVGFGIVGTASKTNVSNNIVSSNTDDDGVSIDGNNNTIANNTVFENIGGNGLSVSGFNNVVVDNNVTDNLQAGIKLIQAYNTTVARNNLTNNSRGIMMEKSSNNTVVNNDAYANRFFGITLALAMNNSVTRNNVTSNVWYGIYSYDSMNNGIAENNVTLNNLGIYIWLRSMYNNVSRNDVYNNGVGIGVSAASDNNVTYNEVHSNTFDGIKLSDAEVNYVANNNVSLNGGDGIHIESTYNNDIFENDITDNSQNGILIDSSVGRDRITNNTVALNVFNGISLVDGGDIRITNNTISSNSQNGIGISGSSWNNISNNNIGSNNWNGIQVSNASNNEILHNNIISNIGSGVNVRNSSDNDILYNDLTSNSIGASVDVGSYDNRMAFNNVSYNVIKGMVITGKGVKSVTKNNTIFENPVGISIADMSLIGPPMPTDHLVSNNTIFNNTIGMEMLTISTGFVEKVKVITNSIYRNDIGINISGSVWDYYISENTIDDNRIGLQSDTVILGGSYIVSNTFTNNQDLAILLLDTFGTHIYHNSFISNGFIWQVVDDTDANSWNTLYPQGGNYWSDYSPTCQDLFDGSVTPQNSGSPDGICDDQYDIDMNSADYYPLTTEFEEWSAPPTNLSAELAGVSSENVIVSWNASLEDPVNVTKYAIYYNTSYDGSGSDYRFLGEVPATGAPRYSINVMGLGEGDPNNYYFQVQANTSKVYMTSRSESQAMKYTRNLTAGMQLISMPVIVENESISNVLQTVKFDIAWYYDNSDPLDPWKSHNPSKSLNDLTTANHTMGLWLVVNRDCNFTVAGAVPKRTDIRLKKGWNLVGYPSIFPRSATDALGGLNVLRIEGYSPMPPEHLQLLLPTSMMLPGHGYWIKMGSDAIWTLED